MSDSFKISFKIRSTGKMVYPHLAFQAQSPPASEHVSFSEVGIRCGAVHRLGCKFSEEMRVPVPSFHMFIMNAWIGLKNFSCRMHLYTAALFSYADGNHIKLVLFEACLHSSRSSRGSDVFIYGMVGLKV